MWFIDKRLSPCRILQKLALTGFQQLHANDARAFTDHDHVLDMASSLTTDSDQTPTVICHVINDHSPRYMIIILRQMGFLVPSRTSWLFSSSLWINKLTVIAS